MAAETRFGALKDLRRDAPPAISSSVDAIPSPSQIMDSPGRAVGKSSSKDFERLTIYVRKSTKKTATRKWEDATGLDMSDLVEHLLTQYLNT